MNESLENGESLIVESTLSGLSLRKQIEKARRLNYQVRIVFVYLDSAELCIQRIKSRVARGGHFVPDEDVRRRYVRANINFRDIYQIRADKWNLFFNAGTGFEQVAAGEHRGVIIIDETLLAKMDWNNETGNGSTSEESLCEALEIQRLGNRAVRRAQEENRRLGIPNWYSIGGEIVSDQQIARSTKNHQEMRDERNP